MKDGDQPIDSTQKSLMDHNGYPIMYRLERVMENTRECINSEVITPVIHTESIGRVAKTARTLARFPDKPNTPCIEWTGKKTPLGYGYFCQGGMRYAHRDAWERAHNQQVPKGMMVCHSCDNRGCINPEHLWIGTQADNMGDCKAKGRPRGRKPKFPEAEMRRIAAMPESSTELGRQFGLAHDTVYRWRKAFNVTG